MQVLKKNYEIQKQDAEYLRFIKNKIVLGTWDDHDFGAMTAGEEYPLKSQQLCCWIFIGIQK
jgi:alkaline phosphatase D